MNAGRSASSDASCGAAALPVSACCMVVLSCLRGTKKAARGTSTGRRGSHVATCSVAHTPPLASRGSGHVVIAVGVATRRAIHGSYGRRLTSGCQRQKPLAHCVAPSAGHLQAPIPKPRLCNETTSGSHDRRGGGVTHLCGAARCPTDGRLASAGPRESRHDVRAMHGLLHLRQRRLDREDQHTGRLLVLGVVQRAAGSQHQRGPSDPRRRSGSRRDRKAKPGTNEWKVGTFYDACMDTTAIEALGTKPIEPQLQEIAAINSSESLRASLGKLDAQAGLAPFGFFV